MVTAVAGLFIGKLGDTTWRLRLALFASVGALLGFDYFTLQLPGVGPLRAWIGNWGAVLLSWMTGLLTLVFGALWTYRYQRREYRSQDSDN